MPSKRIALKVSVWKLIKEHNISYYIVTSVFFLIEDWLMIECLEIGDVAIMKLWKLCVCLVIEIERHWWNHFCSLACSMLVFFSSFFFLLLVENASLPLQILEAAQIPNIFRDASSQRVEAKISASDKIQKDVLFS